MILSRLNHIATTLAVSVTSSSVFAHAGHDHSHWASDAVHAIAAFAVVSVVAAVAFAIKKGKSAQKNR